MTGPSDALPEGVRAIWLSTPLSRTLGYGVYVFRAGPWLIDAGFRHARRQLLGWPGLHGAEACLLTHHHEDHVGNGSALGGRSIELLAPRAVADSVTAGGRLYPYQRLIWGTPQTFDAAHIEGRLTSSGWSLDPVHTPGHSPDHYVYHEPERGIVFSGDLYIASRIDVAKSGEDVGQLLASLKAVRALEPEIMLCAHRGRVDRPLESLTRKIEWLEELIGEARGLAERGFTVEAITRQLLGKDGRIYWITWGDFSKRRLIESALQAE